MLAGWERLGPIQELGSIEHTEGAVDLDALYSRFSVLRVTHGVDGGGWGSVEENKMEM